MVGIWSTATLSLRRFVRAPPRRTSCGGQGVAGWDGWWANARAEELAEAWIFAPNEPSRRQFAKELGHLAMTEAARRFGYTPGSFRVLVHEFRNQIKRDFFAPPARQGRPLGKHKRLREQVIALRKQNLSVHDISLALAREDASLSPAAVAAILKEEGFAKLPRRADDDRPDRPRPVVADVADIRQLDLKPRHLRTKFGGLFLFLPLADRRRPRQTPGASGIPRIGDGPGRVGRAVAAGLETLRQRPTQSCHEFGARRGTGPLRRLERGSQAVVLDRIQ